MNIDTWIGEHLKVVSSESGKAEAEIVFPEDFSLFAGHFPGNPTLPGVCEIICAEMLLSKVLGRIPTLLEIGKAKFFAPVPPGKTLNIKIGWIEKEGLLELSADLSVDENKTAGFKKFLFR